MTSNPDEWGVKDAGFYRPTYEEILAAVKNDMRLLFGTDIDLSSESPVGQLAQVIARQMAETWADGEYSYDAGFIRSATGINLDNLAEIRQISRNPATYATGDVKFSRATPAQREYPIPAGTVVATTDRSLTFQTTESGTISAGASTSSLIPIIATSPGQSYNLQANTVTVIATPVLGIDTVNNLRRIAGGTDAESDAVYRARIKKTVPESSATLSAITSALTAVDGVSGVNITEDTNYAVVYAYISGGTDAEIEAAIYSVRPAGVAVIWNRPTDAEINVTGTATANAAEIAEAIKTYLNSLSIGGDVAYSSLVSAAALASGGAQLLSLTASHGSQTASSLGDTIVIADGAIASAGTITITEE